MCYFFNFKCYICRNNLKNKVTLDNEERVISCNSCGTNYSMDGSNIQYYTIMYRKYCILFDPHEVEIRVYNIEKYSYTFYPICFVDKFLTYNKLMNKLKKLKVFV